MEQIKESAKLTTSNKRISKLHRWDNMFELLFIAIFISILSNSDGPMSSLLSNLLGAVAGLQIGIWILKEQAEEKQRNIGHEERQTRLYHYLGALWLILVIIPFIATPPDFSKPMDYILTIAYIFSWLGMFAILFFRGITSKNK